MISEGWERGRKAADAQDNTVTLPEAVPGSLCRRRQESPPKQDSHRTYLLAAAMSCCCQGSGGKHQERATPKIWAARVSLPSATVAEAGDLYSEGEALSGAHELLWDARPTGVSSH